MDQANLSLLILAGAVALFVWNKLPVEFVTIRTALTVSANRPLAFVGSAGSLLAPTGTPINLILRHYARNLVQHQALERDRYRLPVRPRSPYVGVSREDLDLSRFRAIWGRQFLWASRCPGAST